MGNARASAVEEMVRRSQGLWLAVSVVSLLGALLSSFAPAHASTPTLSDLVPNGGEVFAGGSVARISWNQSHGGDAEMRATITYSLDGGATYPYFITSEPFLAGRAFHDWTTPTIDRTTARVRVCAVGSDYDRGCVSSAGDFSITATPPWVAILSPSRDAWNVSHDSPIVLHLQDIDTPTVSWSITPTIALTPTWTNNNTVLTLSHASAFQLCTRYDVLVYARDYTGGNRSVSWSFSTQCSGPYVVLTSPADGAVNVPLSEPIVVVFSHRMDPPTVTFTFVPTMIFTPTWTANDTILTLSHTSPFQPNTTYTVSVSGHDIFGDALIPGPVPNPWSFSTGGGTTGSPYIVYTDPAHGQVISDPYMPIHVAFSESMNTTSVYWMITPAITMNATWPDPANLFLSHTLPFTCGVLYTVQVGGQDLQGNPLVPGPVPNPWNFTMACPNPFIVSTHPANGETNVSLSANIFVDFSEPMDPSTLRWNVTPFIGFSPNWVKNNTTLEFLYTRPLPACTTIQIQVWADDVDGNLLIPGPVPNPWSFTTACGLPYIVSTTPANGATNVSRTANLVVAFSEAMNRTSVAAMISPPVGNLTYQWPSSSVVNVLHDPLAPCTSYTVNVTGRDPDGNPLQPGPVPNPWSFTTVCPRPYVVSTYPPDGSRGILRDAAVMVTFSEAMNGSSVVVSIVPAVSGIAYSWSTGGDVLTVTHAPFQRCLWYTGTVSGESALGLPLVAGPVSNPWSFQVSCATISVALLVPLGGESWTGGTDHAVSFRVYNGLPTTQSILVDAVYRHSGGAAGGTVGSRILLVGPGSTASDQFVWTTPPLDATDVVVNLTATASPAGDVAWAESGPLEVDSTPPAVVSASPSGPHAPFDPLVVIRFSEAMNAFSARLPSITPPVAMTPFWPAPDRFEAQLTGTTPCTPYSLGISTPAAGPWTDDSDPGNPLPPFVLPFQTMCLPSVDLLVPAGGEDWTGLTVHTVQWTLADADDPTVSVVLSLSIDGGATFVPFTLPTPWATGAASFPWSLPRVDTAGAVLRVDVTDSDGNTATDRSLPFTIDSTPPAILTSFPLHGASGFKTTREIWFAFTEFVNRASFQAAFSIAPNPGGISLSWAVISGTDVLTVAHDPFKSNTAYTVTFGTAAKDDSDPGNYVPAPLVVRFNTKPPPNVNPPVAKAVGKRQVEVGEPVTLDGRGSTGNITSHVWRIMDNQGHPIAILLGSVVTYTFQQNGRYSVTLIVTDVNGLSDDDTLEIAVTSNPHTAGYLAAGGALLVAALVASTEPGKYGLFGWVLFPMYVRRKRNEALEHQTRGMILGYVMVHPGDTYTDIKRNLLLSNGTLSYHLRVLERDGLLRAQTKGAHKLFFPLGVRVPEDGGGLHEIQMRMLGAIREVPGLAVKDIAGALGITSQHALYHLRALAAKGLIHLERRGLHLRCFAEAAGTSPPKMPGF